MAVDINKMIQYMVDLKNRGITYSMSGSRNGTDGTGDCSGTVVEAVFRAGGIRYSWLFNTDSMHTYLLNNGFVLVYENASTYQPKRGDIFIWGKKNQSGGAFGHTGVFYDDNENIIHCNYGYNGVTINNVDTIMQANGNPYYYIYRLNGAPSQPQPQPTPQPVANRRYGYRIDDIQFVNGIWQIRCNYLCQAGFDWTDNGIPAVDVDIINPNTGAMTADQNNAKVGDYFAFNPSRVRYIGQEHHENGRVYRSVQTTQGLIWMEYRTSQQQLIYG